MTNKVNLLELNRQAWNKIAYNYEKHRPKWLDKHNPLFEYFCANLPKSSYVLDLGSGTGLPYAKSLIERGFKVLGIDLSKNMVNIAQKNVPGAKFIQLSMTKLDYKNRFEGMLSSFSMLSLDPKQIKEVSIRVAKALKKEGLFYLSLNEPPEEFLDIDNYTYTIIEIMGQKMYSRPYTEEEISKIFSPLGMKLLKLHREIQVSDLFGEEHTISFVFKKI